MLAYEGREIVPYLRAGHLDILKRLVLLLHDTYCWVKHFIINAFRKTYITFVTVVAEPVVG